MRSRDGRLECDLIDSVAQALTRQVAIRFGMWVSGPHLRRVMFNRLVAWRELGASPDEVERFIARAVSARRGLPRACLRQDGARAQGSPRRFREINLRQLLAERMRRSAELHGIGN